MLRTIWERFKRNRRFNQQMKRFDAGVSDDGALVVFVKGTEPLRIHVQERGRDSYRVIYKQ